MHYHIANTEKNQTFRILANKSIVDFILRTYRGHVFCSLFVNDTPVFKSKIAFNDVPLLSAAQALQIGTQFYFHDIDGLNPNTDRFDGISCYLVSEEA